MVTPELLEFIEGLELKDDGLETKNEEDTTTEYPIIFSTGEESGQLILTDKEVRKLQVVLSLSVQKDAVPTSVEDRHLKASDEFEDTIMSIIQTVTTEEKIENTVIPLEDEVFTLIQE